MGLPTTARKYLPAGVAAVCYRDAGRYIVFLAPVIQDHIDHGRARREVFRRAREWGHELVALTFDELDELRQRDAQRTGAGLRFYLGRNQERGRI